MRSLLLALALMLSAATVTAATLNVVDGQLLGAFDVEIDRKLYDVEFLDGTCADLFLSPDCSSSFFFAFKTSSDAFTASRALQGQVLLDSESGNFDSNPALTNGCGDLTRCMIHTPYALDRLLAGTVMASWVNNRDVENWDGAGPGMLVIKPNDMSSILGTWAVWTLVPEPVLTPVQQTCLSRQISAGSVLSKTMLACYAKQAKAPAKDPVGAVLSACLAKAEAKFVARFDKATNNAVRDDEQCISVNTSQEAIGSLDDEVDQFVTLVETGADPNSKDDAKLRSALYKAGSKMVGSVLRAEAKDVKKPSAAKLQKVTDKAEAGVIKAFNKIVAKAAKKGVSTSITAQDVIDAAYGLVYSVLDVAEGVEDGG